jgi:hypothetical protein
MGLENVLPANADTLLVITGLGGFQYQARGLTQTLTPINEASDNVRSVNGTMVDLSNPIFRKYTSKITCTDVDAPPLDNLWPGMAVTVSCAVSLCYQTGRPGSPAREQVSGSSYTQGSFTFYRPVLYMMVKNVSQQFEEWKAENGWTIELEEV